MLDLYEPNHYKWKWDVNITKVTNSMLDLYEPNHYKHINH